MRNAVLLAKSKQATKSSSNSLNQQQDALDNGESLEEAVKRIKKDQRKFTYFWEGVKAAVDANEFKQKLDRQQSTLKHHEGKVEQHYVRGVFHPDHPMKITWDLFLAVFVMYSVIVIPYRLGFNVSPTHSESRLDAFITALFAVDILITLNTAYLDPQDEKFVYKRDKIAVEYAKYWFWVDLFATLPFDTIASSFIDPSKAFVVRGIRVLRLGRLVKLYRLLRKSRVLEKLNLSPAVINMFILILQIFFIAHLLACCWHFIALPSAVGTFGDNWITHFNFDGASVGTRYVASFYYIIVTMLTVGYGDIHPVNQIERLFGIITMIIGGVVFGALVAKVTRIIDKRNPQQQAFNAKMKQLKMFLVDTGLPVSIRNRAKMAYSYFLSKKSSFGEMEIIEKLPNYIVHDLVLEMYAGDIEKIKLFKEADPGFIVSLLPLCRPFEAQPEEILFKEGDICNEIVFIKQGTVRILSNNGKKDILAGMITEGGMFGDSEYYRNTTAIATYSATKYCQFLSIGHAQLSNILTNHYSTSQSFNRFVKDRYFALMSVVRSHADADVDSRALAGPAINGLEGGQKPFSSGFGSPLKMFQRKRFTHYDDDTVFEGRARSNARSRSDTLFLSTTASRRVSYTAKRSICIDGMVCDLTTSMHNLDIDPTEAAFSITGSIRVVIKKSGKETVREYPADVLSSRRLVHPQGYYKVRWDFYIGLLIIYSVLVVPIEIAFSGDAFVNQFAWNTVIDVCFFVDIALCFRTCFMSDHLEALVIDVDLIARQYISRWFVIDLFSTFPFDAILIAAGNESAGQSLAAAQLFKTFRILRLLKLLRIFKLGLYVERIEDATGIAPMVFQLIALLLQVFFVVHLACCLYWGLTDSMSSHPWYLEVVTKDESIVARYLVALYFTFTTITTVGYGDLGPNQSGERLLCIFLVLAGASIFGYMIANVSSVLSSLDSDGTSVEKLTEVTEYLNEKRCSPNLRFKIMNHFQKQFQDKTVYDVDHISDSLPPGLRTELLIALHEKRMSKIPIFKYIANQSVSLYLFKLMSPAYYEDGHYITKEGTDAEDVIFLVSGHARAFKISKEPAEIELLNKKVPYFPHLDPVYLNSIGVVRKNTKYYQQTAVGNQFDRDDHIFASRIMSEPVLYDTEHHHLKAGPEGSHPHHVFKTDNHQYGNPIGLSVSERPPTGSRPPFILHPESTIQMQLEAAKRLANRDEFRQQHHPHLPHHPPHHPNHQTHHQNHYDQDRVPEHSSANNAPATVQRTQNFDSEETKESPRKPSPSPTNKFSLASIFNSKDDNENNVIGLDLDKENEGEVRVEMTSIYPQSKEEESIPMATVETKTSPLPKMFYKSPSFSNMTINGSSPREARVQSKQNSPINNASYQTVSMNADDLNFELNAPVPTQKPPRSPLSAITMRKKLTNSSLSGNTPNPNHNDEGVKIEGQRSYSARMWLSDSLKQLSFSSSRSDGNSKGIHTERQSSLRRFFSNKEDRKPMRINSVDSLASLDSRTSVGVKSTGSVTKDLSNKIKIPQFLADRSFASVIASKKRVKTDNLDQLGKPFEALTDMDFLQHGYQLLGEVNPGDFVGHVAFMTSGGLHHASVRTTVPSTVYTFSKNEILKLIRIEPTVGIQLQAALTRATIAQANDVGRYHLRSTRAAFLKRLKTQFFDKHGVSEQTAENKQSSMMDNNLQNDTGSVTSKMDTPPGTDSPRVNLNNNADPDIITLTHRGSASNLQQGGPNIRRRAGASRRASLTGAAGAVFTKPKLPVEKGRKVNHLFSTNRVLYDSDDETHEVNKRVGKDEKRPASLARSKAVRFSGVVTDSLPTVESPKPVVDQHQHDVGRGLLLTTPKNRRNSSEVEVESNQQVQEMSFPLDSTRSAALHLAKRKSVIANNGNANAIPGTSTSTKSILSLPLKVAKAVKNVIHQPKQVEVENVRFERSVSLSELDFVETAGISHLKKFLKPSTSNTSLTAMNSGNNGEDSENAVSRRVVTTSHRQRKGMTRKRRQTFPSKDQDLWRLQKIHQGVVI